MIIKLWLMLLLMVLSIEEISLSVFDQPKNIFASLSDNGGQFDYGFTFTYVGVDPFEFEYFLFIKHHFWKIKKNDYNEREMCIEELESEQHIEFNVPYTYALSYLSDHLVEHDDELNLTNHVILEFTLKSSTFMPEFEHHELIENAFDANHPDLNWLVGGGYYENPIYDFNATVGFQPQSFTDDEELDGPNFVLLQQNLTEKGYVRRPEVHSIVNQKSLKNATQKLHKYIPDFIHKLDPRLFIDIILPTRLGPGGVEEGTPAVILLFLYEAVIRYCVTEETKVDESCNPDHLKQLLSCIPKKDEL